MKSRLLGAVSACALSIALSSAQAVPVSGQGTWETTLQGRDLDGNAATYEAYYDTVLDITWLADANANGAMTWADANSWAANLDVNGVTGWRLPTLGPIDGSAFDYNFTFDGTTDWGYNIGAPGAAYAGSTASEMAHLFYNTLGNLAYYGTNGLLQPGSGLTNTGPFSNLRGDPYWTGLEYVPDPGNAWIFAFHSGFQGRASTTTGWYALAVHPGDVSAVPVPAAVWLFGSGLMGLLAVAKRKIAA